eukprot:UN03094
MDFKGKIKLHSSSLVAWKKFSSTTLVKNEERTTHQIDYKQGNVNCFVIFEKMSSDFELEISEKYEF